MRFAAWNCCSGGATKVAHLEREGVDVAVMCEAPLANPRPSETLTDRPLSWVSVGAIPWKGLAVVGFTRALTEPAPPVAGGRWSVRADVEGGPSVLGIWSCPEQVGGAAYGAEVIAALDAHAEAIAGGEVIVAGDFNVGQGMNGVGANDWAAPVRERWESLDRRHADQGFHIDYVLVHRSKLDRVKDVSVGGFDEWVASGRSDHVPVIVDID